MSDDAQNPGGSDGSAPQAGGGKPGLARKPLVRAGGLGRKAGAGATGGESPAGEPSESTAATDSAPAAPPPAAPAAAPGPAASAPTAASGVASAAASGASKAKVGVIGSVVAFTAFVLLGIIYMKTTQTGAAANQLIGSASSRAAANALGDAPCRETADRVTPLIVDWDSDDRTSVEIAMKQDLAVVHYSCEKFQVLTDCHVAGTYGYTSSTLKEDLIKIMSADELKANLPKAGNAQSGVALATELARGQSISIATALVGRYRSTRMSASTAELKGKCDGATHFVRGANVGAFSFGTTDDAKVKASAQVAGAANSAASTASRAMQRQDGSLDECKKSDPESKTAPNQCRSILRLELVPIDKNEGSVSDGKAAALSLADSGGCPKGMVFNQGKCVQESAKQAHECKGDDIVDCTAQCDQGNATSCTLLGILHAPADPTLPRDEKKALAAFQKACDGGDQGGCARYGRALVYGELGAKRDSKKGSELIQKSSNAGDMNGAFELGYLYNSFEGKRMPSEDWPIPADGNKKVELFQRACDAGLGVACARIANLYHHGLKELPKDPAKALEYRRRACDGGYTTGCVWFADAMLNGRDMPTDIPKGKKLLEDLCSRRKWDACYSLGLYQMYKNAGFEEDQSKGLPNLQLSCDHGSGDGCYFLADLYSKGYKSKSGVVNINKELPKARELFKKACDYDTSHGCRRLAEMLRKGQGGPVDVKQADALIEKGCFQKNYDLCVMYFKDIYKEDASKPQSAVAPTTKAAPAGKKHLPG